MNIFIDLETHPGNKPNLNKADMPVPGNYKKPETIEAYRNENFDTYVEEQWHKQALNSMEGNIWAIGYAFDNNPAQCEVDTEYNMLEALDRKLHAIDYSVRREATWIGHNIKGFDLPWLFIKSAKYDLNVLKKSLPKGRYDKRIFDTMEQFNPWDFKTYVSLDKACEFFGISGKLDCNYKSFYSSCTPDQMQMVHDYCKNDVEITRELYKKLK